MSKKWALKKHNKTFLLWFKKNVHAISNLFGFVLRLARGPNIDVIIYDGYYINNYYLYSKMKNDKSKVQNSGVMLQAKVVHFPSSKDKKFVTVSMSCFGIIQEI